MKIYIRDNTQVQHTNARTHNQRERERERTHTQREEQHKKNHTEGKTNPRITKQFSLRLSLISRNFTLFLFLLFLLLFSLTLRIKTLLIKYPLLLWYQKHYSPLIPSIFCCFIHFFSILIHQNSDQGFFPCMDTHSDGGFFSRVSFWIAVHLLNLGNSPRAMIRECD